MDSHAILVNSETIHQQGGGNQDITQKGESYLRGKWVTIVALDLDSPFELAEIRVYGSECLLLLKKKVFLRIMRRPKEKNMLVLAANL